MFNRCLLTHSFKLSFKNKLISRSLSLGIPRNDDVSLHATTDTIIKTSEEDNEIVSPKFDFRELPGETLYILDGTSMLYNAYYSRESSNDFYDVRTKKVKEDGEEIEIHCGALAAMSMHFARFIRDVKPRYVCAALDASSKTFRNDLYPAYKEQRESAPEDLIPQFNMVEPTLHALGCPTYTKLGYEADDIMAALTVWGRERGLNVCIVSGDKDMLQLVDVGIHVMNPRNRKMMGVSEVTAKYGVPPEGLVDMMALVGDSADNIPGVRGIGPKTAATLLEKFNNIEALYDCLLEHDVPHPTIEDFSLSSVADGTIKKLPPPLEEAFSLGKGSKALTLIKKLAACTYEDVQLYKKLVTLKSDIPGITEMLQDLSSTGLRYVGESDTAENYFTSLHRSFNKPLMLLRRQYHHLDRII